MRIWCLNLDKNRILMYINLPLLSNSTVDAVFSPGFRVEGPLTSSKEISFSFILDQIKTVNSSNDTHHHNCCIQLHIQQLLGIWHILHVSMVHRGWKCSYLLQVSILIDHSDHSLRRKFLYQVPMLSFGNHESKKIFDYIHFLNEHPIYMLLQCKLQGKQPLDH